MRTLFALALTLAAPAALACGPYMPRPTVNAHALVSVELPDGTVVSTTKTAGELRFERDGEVRLVPVSIWTIRDLDVAGDALVVAGSQYGQPTLLVRDGEDWSSVWIEGAWMGDVVDVEASADGDGFVFATVVDSGREKAGATLGVTRWVPTERRS